MIIGAALRTHCKVLKTKHCLKRNIKYWLKFRSPFVEIPCSYCSFKGPFLITVFGFMIEVPIILKVNYDDNNMCWICRTQVQRIHCRSAFIYSQYYYWFCRGNINATVTTENSWCNLEAQPMSDSIHSLLVTPTICEIKYCSERDCKENLATFAQRLVTNNAKMVRSFGKLKPEPVVFIFE